MQMRVSLLRMVLIGLGLGFCLGVEAVDYPANHCEVFIKRIGAAPSSHGVANVVTLVKTGWIGNGEEIQRVRFYGKVEAKDLGNRNECHMSPPYQSDWQEYSPNAGSDFARGEYKFSFLVRTGSVASACPGYEMTWIGTYFVETNKNTYWLNPEMNPDKHFWFNAKAYDQILKSGGWVGNSEGGLSTLRSDMQYYNPRQCQ